MKKLIGGLVLGLALAGGAQAVAEWGYRDLSALKAIAASLGQLSAYAGRSAVAQERAAAAQERIATVLERLHRMPAEAPDRGRR